MTYALAGPEGDSGFAVQQAALQERDRRLPDPAPPDPPAAPAPVEAASPRAASPSQSDLGRRAEAQRHHWTVFALGAVVGFLVRHRRPSRH